MSDKKIKSILFFLFIVVISVIYIGYKRNQNRVKINHIVICGVIESIESGRGGNWLMTYSYVYMGKTYKRGSVFCNNHTHNRYEEGQKYILIAIDKNDFSNSSLIETTEDFEIFRISKSDTMGLKCW